MAGRGVLTEEIAEVAAKTFKVHFKQEHLRLLPYILDCCINIACIDSSRVNVVEKVIILEWQALGFITSHEGRKVQVSKEFWDAAQELMWLAYANK